MLEQEFLGHPVQSWLTAAVIAIGSFVLLKVVVHVAVNRVSILVGRTKTIFDDLALEALKNTRHAFLVIVALYVGSFALSLKPSHQNVLNTIVVIAFLLQGAVWATRVMGLWLKIETERRKERDAATVTGMTALGFIGRVAIWSVVFLLVLENLGVNITALLAGLGIGGIAVALALQNILGDLFASLSIVLDKPFVIGDFVVVDQFSGTVEHIGLKTTRVRSLSGEQIIFSNADLLKSRIRNFKRMHERRAMFTIGVTYHTPNDKLAKVSSILREIVEAHQGTRFDRAHFKEYGDSALLYEVVYYIQNPDYKVYMDIQESINVEIHRRFEIEGIEFAYPTRTLYMHATSEDHRPARHARRSRTRPRE